MRPSTFVVYSGHRDSQTGSSSNFRLDLSDKNLVLRGIRGIKLLGVQIPNTIYNIRSGVNDLISWARGGARSGTLTPGAYSITALLAAIKVIMDANDGGGGNTYTLAYNSSTMKVSITGDSAAFTMNFGTSTTPWKELGFANSNVDSSSLVCTGTNVVSLARPYDLFIKVNEFGHNIGTSSTADLPTFTIPVSGNAGDLIEFFTQNAYKQEIYFGAPRDFHELNIKLFFATGVEADLNGSEWSMYLELVR